jgi:serine phosphatase RsbU (regulator of sigma subunit)
MGHDGFVKHADGTVTLLKGNRKSIAYGSQISQLSLQVVEQPWSDDDTYFLYSDGLTTQVGDVKRTMMGTNRVRETLTTVSGTEPEQLVASVFDKFETWRGTVDVRDDLTMIAVKPRSLKGI